MNRIRVICDLFRLGLHADYHYEYSCPFNFGYSGTFPCFRGNFSEYLF